VRSTYKTIGLWVILIVLFVAFYNFFSTGGDQVQEPTFTQFLANVEANKVRAVSVKGNT
jgi:cell division protease FtsH